MCGILGCFYKRKLNQSDIELMRKIRKKIEHRGPDDKGEWINADKGIYLGHQRLSILDHKGGKQPMISNNNVLIYNGEIYNYLEIFKSINGNKTSTNVGDTRVLMQAWNKWGEKCISKLSGMFAFALLDEKGLNLVTDPFGEKPIYILKLRNGVIFCSEAGPLISEFKLEKDIDESLISEFLSFGHLLPPKTGFKNLYIIPARTHVKIDYDGRLSERIYWKIPQYQQSDLEPFNKINLNKIKNDLITSVEQSLRAEVDLGLFLSGGLDSSLIASIISKELGKKITTYTVSFKDGKDEGKNAQRIANYLHLENITINSLEDELWKKTPENLNKFYGILNDNLTVFSVYQMCEIVKNKIKVVLSGLGGDELFMGYNKYNFIFKNKTFYKLFQNSKFSSKISSYLPSTSKIKNIVDVLKGSQERQFLRIKNGNSFNILENNINIPKSFFSLNHLSLLENVLDFDQKVTLPYSHIPAIERGSMRSSVEVRAPFLNKKLFETASKIKLEIKMKNHPKFILKEILRSYLPKDILATPKFGFVYPSSRYLNKNKKRHFDNEILARKFQGYDFGNKDKLSLRLLILDHFLKN